MSTPDLPSLVVGIIGLDRLTAEVLAAGVRAAGAGCHALARVESTSTEGVDVVLATPDTIDLAVQAWGLDGVDALPPVVLLADVDHPANSQHARRVHARGWVTSEVDVPTLVSVLCSVVHHRARPGMDAVPGGAGSDGLTPRELDVLAHVALGSENSLIAQRLSISAHTVRTHVQNILAKLGADSRFEAVARARASGLLSATVEFR